MSVSLSRPQPRRRAMSAQQRALIVELQQIQPTHQVPVVQTATLSLAEAVRRFEAAQRSAAHALIVADCALHNVASQYHLTRPATRI